MLCPYPIRHATREVGPRIKRKELACECLGQAAFQRSDKGEIIHGKLRGGDPLDENGIAIYRHLRARG